MADKSAEAGSDAEDSVTVTPNDEENTPAYKSSTKASGRKKVTNSETEVADKDSDPGTNPLLIPHGERMPNYPTQLVTDQERINTSQVAELTNCAAVHSIVASSLFPHVKFLDPNKDLEFTKEPGTICEFMLSRCKIPVNVDERDFWAKSKKYVRSSIARLRSDKTSALRDEFFGKWISHCISVKHNDSRNSLAEVWLHETLPEDAIDKKNHKLKVPPKWSIDDMLEGRMNEACYSVYFTRFAPILEKKHIWQQNLINAKTNRDVISISSEAFGLLVLENQ